MQAKKIATLVAVACAGFTGQASAALTTTQIAVLDDANANNRVFFISGASATQAGLNQIVSTLFEAGSFRLANTTASSKDFEAAAGVLKAGNGPWSGKNVIIIDRVKGGSVWGVNPVARAHKVQTLKVTSADCGAAGSGTSSSPYSCNVSTADDLVNFPNGQADGRVPDAGVSDVAPAMFKFPFNTEGESPVPELNETELAEFADSTYNKPLYTLAFGVPVTNNTNPASLNRAVVSAIMTGNIGTWDQVDSTLPADDIVVCRRVQGSGTQAVDNWFFGGFPCDSSANVPAARDAGSAWDPITGNYNVIAATGALNVIENSTSGDVRNCLTAAANATTTAQTYATKDRDGAAVTVTFQPKAGGHRAIGVLSMDSVNASNAAGAWSFRSLDGNGTVTCTGSCPATTAPVLAGTGTFPTQANLMNGSWPLQGWISWNVPPRTAGDANKGPLAQGFAAAAQDPAIIASLNNLKHVAAALPAPFSPYSGANVSKAVFNNGDQCQPLNRNFAP
jgi:hypothetical protein